MIQAELFADNRYSHPDTSKDSHDAAATAITISRRRVLEMFRRFGELTQNEAAQKAVDCFGDYERETYRKRVHELEGDGLVRLVGKRKCRAKPGRTAVKTYKALERQ